MFPLVDFGRVELARYKNNGADVLNETGKAISFRGIAVSGGREVSCVFNAFGDIAKSIKNDNLKEGDKVSIVAELHHYVESGKEKDSFTVVQYSKLEAAPLVTFPVLKVASIIQKTTKAGNEYVTVVASEPFPQKGIYPVRIFNAFGDQADILLNKLKIREGSCITVIATMTQYLDKEAKEKRLSFTVVSVGYVGNGKFGANESKVDPEKAKAALVDLPEITEVPEVEVKRPQLQENEIPEFTTEDFEKELW